MSEKNCKTSLSSDNTLAMEVIKSAKRTALLWFVMWIITMIMLCGYIAYDRFKYSQVENSQTQEVTQDGNQNMAVRIINEYSGEVPEYMQEMWNHKQNKYIEKMALIKQMLSV